LIEVVIDLFPKLLEWLLIPNKCLMMPCRSTNHFPHSHSILLRSSSCYKFKRTIIIFIRRNSPNFTKEKGDKTHLSRSGDGNSDGAGASAGIATSAGADAGARAGAFPTVGARRSSGRSFNLKSSELRRRMEEEDMLEVRGRANLAVPR
jgi:hypothetical protein